MISREGDHLLAKFPTQSRPLVLVPVSPSSFVMPHTDGRFDFQIGEDGRVSGAKFTIGDGERMLKKAAH